MRESPTSMPMDKKDETSSACLIGAVRVAHGHPTFWMDLGAQTSIAQTLEAVWSRKTY